jgi:hypothetical protein
MSYAANRRLFLQSLTAAIGSTASVRGHARKVDRSDRCCDIRSAAAVFHKSQPEQPHPTNGDERRFPGGIASFSKSLLHNSRGEPLPGMYERLVKGLESGSFGELESIPLGGPMKLSNPLALNAFELEGPDSHQLGMVPPPEFSSDEQAGEMVELYWQAIARDIPFSEWKSHETIAEATGDLTARADFRGPKIGGRVTAQTLFRIAAPGVLDGPYVSQFLLAPVPHGGLPMEQRYRVATLGRDFGALYKDWLALQNGLMTMHEIEYESAPRYLATQRGLAGFVHRDCAFQAFLSAALILHQFGPAALSDTNPYKRSRVQAGFATFGEPQIIDCMARAANASLKAAWFQKWAIHRRIRPEEFAFRVHETLGGRADYTLAADLAKSAAVRVIQSSTGGLLLPLAYPEGCPIHPSYPAGHAVVAGACVTVLKAFFNQEFEIPNPVTTDADGAALVPYAETLTVGGELNKLAANLAMARNAAGVHWRSDCVEGIRLGEAVALGLLHDIATTGTEPFQGFRVTTFDGNKVTVGTAAQAVAT